MDDTSGATGPTRRKTDKHLAPLPPVVAKDVTRTIGHEDYTLPITDDERVVDPPMDVDSGYSLHRCVARGGCGEVWEADQQSLERLVAVKMIRTPIRFDTELDPARRHRAMRQFRTEAVTTAHLEHPNIVPVYDLGRDAEGWPMIAMKLVKGDSWDSVLEKDFKSMPVEEYLAKHLDILIAVAQAVAFAHSRGIVHRDIKPSQVMLGEFGEVHLMDWGLAISLADKLPPSTAEKAVHFDGMLFSNSAPSPAGTPAFMAPEQTQRTAEAISFQTDVYLLGATLYTIMAGSPPRVVTKSTACMELASTGEVRPLKQVAPDRMHPPELVELIRVSMAFDPADRPATVQLFMEKLRDYASGASNRAEADSILKESRKSYDAIMAMRGATDSQAVTQLYSACTDAVAELDRARSLAPRNTEIVLLRDEILELYCATAINQGDLILAKALVGLLENKEARKEFRALVKIREDQRNRQKLQRVVLLAILGVLILVLIGSGVLHFRNQQLATIRIATERDIAEEAQTTAEALRRIAETEQYFANIETAQISLERGLANKTDTHLFERTPTRLRNWEWGFLAAAAHPQSMILRAYDSTNEATYTPDANTIITASREGDVLFWDANTGRFIESRNFFESRVTSLSINHTGTKLLATSLDRKAVIVDLETRDVVHRLGTGDVPFRRGAWSHDGQVIAITGHEPNVRLWNAETGESLGVIGEFTSGIIEVQFNPVSHQLAIADRDGNAGVWDPRTRMPLFQFEGVDESITEIRYTADGSAILAVSPSGALRQFDASNGTLISELEIESGIVISAVMVDGTELVVVARQDGDVRLMNWTTGETIARVATDAPLNRVELSPDRANLLVSSRSQARVYSLRNLPDAPIRTQIVPTGEQFAEPDDLFPIFGLTSGRDPVWDQRERLWNTQKGRTFFEIDGRQVAFESRYTRFSPDARFRFDINPDTLLGTARNTETDEVVYQHESSRLLTSTFSPDGRYLAIVNPIDRVHLLDTATWEIVRTIRSDPDDRITVPLDLYICAWVEFSPDSKILVVTYLNGHVTGWNVDTGEQLFKSDRHRGIGASVAFDQSGRRFVVAGNDHRATVWSARDGSLLAELVGHTLFMHGASFSPNGERIVTFARDRTVRLWDTESGREILTVYEAPAGRAILSAGFTGDGQSILVALDNGAVRRLDTVPWNPSHYDLPNSNMTMAERFEYHNRRMHLGDHITPQDVLAAPELRHDMGQLAFTE